MSGEERQRIRVVSDLAIIGHGVNTDTDFDTAPACDLGDVMFRSISCARRQQVRAEVPIYLRVLKYVKDAFRRVHIEWGKAYFFFICGGEVHRLSFQVGVRMAFICHLD